VRAADVAPGDGMEAPTRPPADIRPLARRGDEGFFHCGIPEVRPALTYPARVRDIIWDRREPAESRFPHAAMGEACSEGDTQ
jgi:hypothetical protein